MARPQGSYRGARRNEAKQSKKPMLTIDDLRRINTIYAQQQQAAARPSIDPYREELKK